LATAIAIMAGKKSDLMIAQVLSITKKDLLLERRGKANLNALVFLAGLILVVISFALGPSPSRLQSAAAGVLWVAFAFAGIIAFGRAYQTESDNRCFEGMVLAGANPKAIYLGKLAATMTVMLLVEIVVVGAMGVLYNLHLWGRLPILLLIALLGTVGFASVGILYGRLTMTLRAREVLLPVLVLPVVLPVVLAAVRASGIALSQAPLSELSSWIELLVVFDIVFVAAGLLTFESLCEE
jgi:heme exporter protein B